MQRRTKYIDMDRCANSQFGVKTTSKYNCEQPGYAKNYGQSSDKRDVCYTFPIKGCVQISSTGTQGSHSMQALLNALYLAVFTRAEWMPYSLSLQ